MFGIFSQQVQIFENASAYQAEKIRRNADVTQGFATHRTAEFTKYYAIKKEGASDLNENGPAPLFVLNNQPCAFI